MSGDLRKALGAIETLAIPPLMRVQNTMPRDLIGTRWSSYVARRSEMEREVEERLELHGARIEREWQAAEITLQGITARSRLGLLQALRNWQRQARIALELEKRP